MEKMNDLPFVFPTSFEGEWRLILIGDFGEGKKECFRVRFDLVDV